MTRPRNHRSFTFVGVALLFGTAGCSTSSNAAPAGADAGDSGQSDSEGSCGADLSSDRLNCGRCGHSCGDGECVDGACKPYIFAQGLKTPSALTATNDSIVVATNETDVIAIDKLTRRVVPIATAQKFPAFIAGSREAILWTNGGDVDSSGATISFVPKTGSVVRAVGGSLSVVAAMRDSPSAIVVDASGTYWCDLAGLHVSDSSGAIRRLATAVPYGLAVDSDMLYFTEYDTGSVRAIPKSGGATRTLATKQVGPSQILVDGDFVYWTGFSTTPGAGGLYRTRRDGSDYQRLQAATRGYGIAATPSAVYFGDLAGGVHRFEKATMTATMVSVDTASFMAADDNTVYWSRPRSGLIMAWRE